MWFARFWRRPTPRDVTDGHDESTRSRGWQDSDLADEVEAFLTGRLAGHIAATGQAMPAWAALNRLAHADRSELMHFVEGVPPDRLRHPSSAEAPWVATERFVAEHLLARAPTPTELARIQLAVLVPMELNLITRSRIDRLTAEQVLEAGAEALDTFHPGH
jgi:hypothetical protein